MDKRVVAVLVCTLLALTATTLWVPALVQDEGMASKEWDTEWTWLPRVVREGGHELEVYRKGEVMDDGTAAPIDWKWHTRRRLHWPLFIGSQALVLLLSGGLLTFVVRRERRRKAAVA